MIKILFAFNGTPHSGGTEAVMMNYYRLIDRNRFSIDFLFHGTEEQCVGNEFCEHVLSTGGRIFYVTPRGENFLKNRREIATLLAEHKYDIIHSHMDAAGAFVLPLAKKAGIPVRAAHSHNTDDQISKGSALKNAAYRLVLTNARRKIAAQSNLRLACSDLAGQWLFGRHPFTVINNGVDCEHFAYSEEKRRRIRDELGLGDKLVLGHVGRLCAQKNQNRLLDIFSLVHREKPNTALVLVGDGEDRQQLTQRVEREFPDGSVILTGVRHDTDALLAAFDVFVLPSLFEGLCIAAIEAQAASLPCVLSDTVPLLAKQTELVRYCPISGSDELWRDEIFAAAQQERIPTRDTLIAAGFDSASAVRALESEYEKVYNKQIQKGAN